MRSRELTSQTDRKRILVTTAQWESALACVQSYGRRGHDVFLLDHDPRQPNARSKYCRGVVRSPPESNGAAYLENLIAVLRDGAYDLLVPISDAVVDTIAGHVEEIRRHVRVELAPAERVLSGQNKAKLAKFAPKHGIRIPESYFPDDLNQARSLADRIGYPCVAKLPMGTGSTGVQVVRSADTLVAFFEQRGAPDNWPFVQEFVGGDLYDVTAVCDRGNLVAHFAFRSPIESQVGGTPPYAFTVNDPALIEATRQVVRALDWHGAVDFDFLRDATGQYLLLELNPRFSGTINFACKMGVDLPGAYFDLAFDNLKQSYQRDYAEGILFRTIVPAEILYWNRARWVAGKEILRRSVQFPMRTNIYWSDTPLLLRKLRQAGWLIAHKWP